MKDDLGYYNLYFFFYNDTHFCSIIKARDWQKALQLYEDVKEMNMKLTVSMMNALLTALCMSYISDLYSQT